MLVQRQLTNRILGDAQRLKKQSEKLCHDCRNTRSVSLLLRALVQDERNSRPSSMQTPFLTLNKPPKLTM
jgi:hypothetical protein